MDRLLVLDHPLIQSKLASLRDQRTPKHDFRRLLKELTALMVYEITRDFPVIPAQIETPLETTTGVRPGVPLVLVPILRAGVGMLDGVLELVPWARVGHVGIYRDHESLQPVVYYAKLPDGLAESWIIVVDPMLATGGSVAEAVRLIKESGGTSIRFLCLVAAPEGVALLTRAHPDVPIYAAALDRQLNEHGYILPGLGDAGDRIFGT
ncbi:uracil phosphoribosyltransferase [Candidatus Fermentibacteria bacterium]|nr:uracil phosphoribosyltransferase [Candidatus Fermentibacteria bacterium]